ncbi:unnamed protein product, partial [Rotaria magnacalcarata]
VLLITQPDRWTAASMYQATRIFASNMDAKMAQRFYNILLLPRIRDDIDEYKKLNFHLYMALRKALFKPSAFFKGIILPLCEFIHVHSGESLSLCRGVRDEVFLILQPINIIWL